MRKNIIATIILLVTGAAFVNAQNQYRITQYMLHHSFINPAATGNSPKLNAALFYRSQWVGIEGAPVTQGLSVNVPLKDQKHNLGFYAYNDKIGVNKDLSFAGTYAFNAKVSDKATLAFGTSASLELRQSNYGSVDVENVNDPMFQANSKMFALPNFRFGTYFFTDKFYAGFSIPNLLENKIIYESSLKGNTSFNAKDFHYYLQGGYSFKVAPKLDLNVSTLLKQVSGAPLQIDINPQLVIQKKVGIGVSYRTSEEIAGLVNFQVAQMFRIGYSYDYSFSTLGKYSNGSHEVMIIYNLSDPKQPVVNEAPRF